MSLPKFSFHGSEGTALYILQHIHPDNPRLEFWINEVGVAPTHHGQGVGKALMRALLEVAQAAGCAEAWVLTERDNLPAMRLYTSIGGGETPDETVMFTFRLVSF
ncbi:MAG: GNAT family N-acetyltransferase [Syntrophobacteria bacterium]